MKGFIRTISLIAGLAMLLCWTLPSQGAENSLDRIKKRGYLLWGADAEGGAPYIFPSPEDPSKMIGFEVELADAIAREMGVTARQSQNA